MGLFLILVPDFVQRTTTLVLDEAAHKYGNAKSNNNVAHLSVHGAAIRKLEEVPLRFSVSTSP